MVRKTEDDSIKKINKHVPVPVVEKIISCQLASAPVMSFWTIDRV